MVTEILPLTEESIEKAAALLRAGQLVAIPTETVYGLAANAFSEEAVGCIFQVKGRPGDNPLIVHIAKTEDLPKVAKEIPEEALCLAEAFWPGPLTLVLPKREDLPAPASAGLSTVGVRLPAHEGARRVIEAARLPLAAPSANLSGTPSPTTALHVANDLSGKIPLILDGGAAPVGVESTVLSLAGEPVVLRPGFVTAEEIAEVLGRPVRYSKTVTQPPKEGTAPRSPGVKYRHYAPKASLTLVLGSAAAYARFLAGKKAPGTFALCYEEEAKSLPLPAVTYGKRGDEASQSAGLYAALRRLDEEGAETVYAHCEETEGRGLAVYNRLLRAAGFRAVQP